MEWRQFVMDLGALPVDAVEEVFARHGAESITLSDAGDNPVFEPAPGEAPLWSEVRITGLFSASTDFDRLREDLMRSFMVSKLPPHRIDLLEDRVWEREWLKDFHAMRFGRRLWVCPGDSGVTVQDAVIVYLDPGLAFGTGTHPTTALCLEWLDGLDLAGRRVLDFGCGSGILSVASLKLGAASVTAVDIDAQALAASRQNAERNAVESGLRATLDACDLDAAYDVAVANILAAPLIAQAGTICERLVHGGAIALSGIIEHQIADVLAAYRAWIEFEPTVIRAPWARLAGRRI
jgi:ribosomal protein L11 methyltransferase